MSADYFLPPTPNTSLPKPYAKSTWSLNYTKAGVDTGEVIIKGGSHLDFSWIPNQAFGASLRGPDIIDWYTTAWFDKYLKHEASADARLLSERWRNDPVSASVDPGHDGNAISFYYYSRLDIHLFKGGVFDCEDLRDGCPGMVTNDGYPGNYSYLAIDTTPDAVTGPGAALKGSSSLFACVARKSIHFRMRRGGEARPITKVRVYVDGKLVLTRRGRSLRSLTIPGLPGSRRHIVKVKEFSRGSLVRVVKRKVWGCARK